ncbi:hypothetical protein I4U23_015779 [Adineta vaga]|nr:hypothetical protein I4U23_015779 [Adineta vaga]
MSQAIVKQCEKDSGFQNHGREVARVIENEGVDRINGGRYGSSGEFSFRRIRNIFLPFIPQLGTGAMGSFGGGMQGGSNGYMVTANEVLYNQ